jgi:cell division septation protein DedD
LTVDPPATQTAAGAYVLQLGAVRTRKEAQAIAEKARKMHADVFGSRTISVNEAVYGNMGRFYRAQISAFNSPVESEALCASLRQRGVDCMVVKR